MTYVQLSLDKIQREISTRSKLHSHLDIHLEQYRTSWLNTGPLARYQHGAERIVDGRENLNMNIIRCASFISVSSSHLIILSIFAALWQTGMNYMYQSWGRIWQREDSPSQIPLFGGRWSAWGIIWSRYGTLTSESLRLVITFCRSQKGLLSGMSSIAHSFKSIWPWLIPLISLFLLMRAPATDELTFEVKHGL